MIRYVLAALLGVAILALGLAAIDASASETTERALQVAIADVEEAAVELAAYEEPSPEDHPDPQRVVEVSIPERSLTTVDVTHLEIDPMADRNGSVARYVLADGTTNEVVLEERIVYRDPTDDRPTEIRGGGVRTVRLVLLSDADGDPVVVVEPSDGEDVRSEFEPPGV